MKAPRLCNALADGELAHYVRYRVRVLPFPGGGHVLDVLPARKKTQRDRGPAVAVLRDRLVGRGSRIAS